MTNDPSVESKTVRVLAWLDDAFAMERALADVLERRAEDAADEELVRGRILRHLDTSREHADILRECMHELGGAPSTGRRAYDEPFGSARAMADRPDDDVMVKDAISDYALEYYAIASYRALVEALRDLGRHDLAERLGPIVRHEEDMAEFLERQLPVAVRERLADKATHVV